MPGTISQHPVKFGSMSVGLKRDTPNSNSPNSVSVVFDGTQYFNVNDYPDPSGPRLKHKVHRVLFDYQRELLDKIQAFSNPDKWESTYKGKSGDEIKELLPEDPEFKHLIRDVLKLLSSLQQSLNEGKRLSPKQAGEYGDLFKKYGDPSASDAERLQSILQIRDLPGKIKRGKLDLKTNRQGAPIIQILLSEHAPNQVERSSSSRGGAKQRMRWESGSEPNRKFQLRDYQSRKYQSEDE
ncbi:MAG TPA: hypothetical protein V6C52_04625 [Coleofasciculaceae cyanobacterium]|jgi:hypothetical protein